MRNMDVMSNTTKRTLYPSLPFLVSPMRHISDTVMEYTRKAIPHPSMTLCEEHQDWIRAEPLLVQLVSEVAVLVSHCSAHRQLTMFSGPIFFQTEGFHHSNALLTNSAEAQLDIRTPVSSALVSPVDQCQELVSNNK